MTTIFLAASKEKSERVHRPSEQCFFFLFFSRIELGPHLKSTDSYALNVDEGREG